MIEWSFITRDSLNPNHPCGGKTTKQTGLTLWVLFWLWSYSLWGFKGERLLRLEPVQRYRNDEEICKVSKESFRSNCLFIVISIYRLIFRKGVQFLCGFKGFYGTV